MNRVTRHRVDCPYDNDEKCLQYNIGAVPNTHVHKKHMKVMSLLIDLRMKSVTHRAIDGLQLVSVWCGSLFYWLLDGDIEMIVSIIKLMALPVIHI